MPNKKICMITYMKRPEHCPPLYNTAISLVKKGYEVVGIFLFSEYSTTKKETIIPGFSIIFISLTIRDCCNRFFKNLNSNKIFLTIRYLLVYIEYSIKTIYHAIKINADLYEAHDIQAILPTAVVAKLFTKKFLYRAHELFAEKSEPVWLSYIHKIKEKTFIKYADLVVTPEKNRALIYENEYKISTKPLIIQNTPIYRPKISSQILYEKFKELNINVSKIVIYQGLLADDRCIDEIITAAESFHDSVKLVIIGQGFGRWYNYYKKSNNFKNLLILPYVNYNQLPHYTASADIGILMYRNTCRNNYFCAPNKLFEYMMMGLPVITCNYPGLIEIVEKNEIGLCVNPESPEEIASAVNKLATDNELYNKMSNNCLMLSKSKYNWEIEFQKFYPKYKELLQDSTLEKSINEINK